MNQYTYFFACFLIALFFTVPVTALPSQHSLPLQSAETEYVFKEIKLPGDVSIRDIKAILQEKRGFIWIGGKHGLLRYDGHDFKSFRYIPGSNNSIVDTEILSLYLHADTLLCIGGMHGISLMDVRSEKIINLTHDQDGIPVEYVSEFFLDPDGKLWIAALKGLYSLSTDFSEITNHYLKTPPYRKGNPAFAQRAYCIEQHPADKNILMVGTEFGLVSFDKKQNKLHKTYPNEQATFWRTGSSVYKFQKDGNYLWAMSWISGMPRFDMVSEKWENFDYPRRDNRLKKDYNVWAMRDFLLKDENELWVCDWDRGLFVFDKKKKQLIPLKGKQNCPVLNKMYMHIFVLGDGSVWLSNYEGLWKQNSKAKRFRSLDIPFDHTWVSSYLHEEEEANYYFGLHWESYGLACWNSARRTWTYFQTETDKDEMFSAYALFKDSQGEIWVGSAGRGLWYLDKKHKKLRAFSRPDKLHDNVWDGTIYTILEDSRKNLWVGTGKYGVVRLNPNRTKADYFQNKPEDNNSIIGGTHYRAIEEDKFGRIWIGNYTGFCVFDPKTETFSREIADKLNQIGTRNSDTYSIVRDNDDAMWLTITGEGLVRVTENPKNIFHFKTYQTDDGLKDLSVKYMTKDKQGGLWIVNNGLIYINPYTEYIELIDEQNGLLENIDGDGRLMVDKYGNVFCGEEVGENWLEKIKLQTNPEVSNLIIEKVTINGNTTEWNSEMDNVIQFTASKKNSNITFRYTAICFGEYDQVRYRYKLEELEKSWSSPTRMLEARYTNLKPGKYRFVVDAAYKGNWLGYNQLVEVNIRKVFWKTWWFISLLGILLAAIVYTIILNSKQHKERQKRIRLKIASNLHDDIGSTLSSISIMSDIAQSNWGNPDSEKMIRKIGDNAQEMLESIDDIIWSVNPQNDTFESLILRIRKFAAPLFESKNIRFKISEPDEIMSLTISMEIRHNLFLIAKEAINNLVKYSECSEATIDFMYSHSTLKMTITDNGKGFDTTKDYGRNGLTNMKFRGEKMGGKVYIRSVIGEGTKISLIVKIG